MPANFPRKTEWEVEGWNRVLHILSLRGEQTNCLSHRLSWLRSELRVDKDCSSRYYIAMWLKGYFFLLRWFSCNEEMVPSGQRGASSRRGRSKGHAGGRQHQCHTNSSKESQSKRARKMKTTSAQHARSRDFWFCRVERRWHLRAALCLLHLIRPGCFGYQVSNALTDSHLILAEKDTCTLYACHPWT